MYKKISDYAIIGNLHSVALIGIDGSIDWLCLPHIDSASVFGALLDDKKGGFFSIMPMEEWDSSASYLDKTNILLTKFRTKKGILQLTDFMPVPLHGEDDKDEENHELYRVLEVKEGNVKVRIHFEPRFDYAREMPVLEMKDSIVFAYGKKDIVSLSAEREMRVNEDNATAVLNLKEGDTVWIRLHYGQDAPIPLDRKHAEKALRDTETFWKMWLEKSETITIVDLGPYEKMVNRSALTLKLLYYSPTGTIAAAATTSIPEDIGGERNWDYRFTWLRDTSFTLQALFNLGHLSEMEGYLRWIEKIISEHGADKLQIMYGLRGEEELPEKELDHLNGYKGSRPVRIGNKAAKQRQLDIYGEIMDAALKLSDYVGKIDKEMWPFLRAICDYVYDHWQEKDNGIWEVRGGPYHFVYSKVMCWVALDRGITIARRYGFSADLKKWETTKDKIKAEVLEKGYNSKKKSFVQHYETDAVDASNLLIPLLGFLSYDDPRVMSTIEATQNELSHNGLLYRYSSEDGLKGSEGAFLLCSFWLIDNLINLGKLEEAEKYLHKMEMIANNVGLFAEEYDLEWNEQLGNFPQAFTHIGYINSVVRLCKTKNLTKGKKASDDDKPHAKRLFGRIILNDGEPEEKMNSREIIGSLKKSMNILRGAFFDKERGRVAYELMNQSKAYREYVKLTYSLKNIRLDDLKTREEKIAFWVNLYNVIVIHGVIELGIMDSVKEVRNFFRRVQYRIGRMIFSPDDIEHGILRGNRKPPRSMFKLFKNEDERHIFSVDDMDSRIHFALVCASSSCPPIEIYTAENLDKELTISGETFLNAGSISIQRETRVVSLSRIFQWYAEDFGKNISERLRFIAPYLYEKEDRDFIEKNADSLEIVYQDYDWRLNRYEI